MIGFVFSLLAISPAYKANWSVPCMVALQVNGRADSVAGNNGGDSAHPNLTPRARIVEHLLKIEPELLNLQDQVRSPFVGGTCSHIHMVYDFEYRSLSISRTAQRLFS